MQEIKYLKEPFPHVIVENIVEPKIYQDLKFPEIEKKPGAGRTGRDLYPGEPEWNQVLTDENWLRTYQDLTSSEFVFKILRQFSDDFKENECLMNLDEAFLEDFTESRIQMQQSILSEDYNPNSLFIRFDFQASDGTHGLRSPHVDHLRRIVGGVIFF